MPVCLRAAGKRLGSLLLLFWLVLSCAHAGELPLATDLRAEAARAARQGGPLIVLFSRQDCRYCATVRNNYLIPLAGSPNFGSRIIVRQVDQDSDAPLIDFQGRKTSHAAFAARESIKLTPVVAFFDTEGRPLSAAIIGLRLTDFYQAYLEAAVEESFKKLQAR